MTAVTCSDGWYRETYMEQHKPWAGWVALLIALMSLLPYLSTLQADFAWDDDLLTVDHACYRDPTL